MSEKHKPPPTRPPDHMEKQVMEEPQEEFIDDMNAPSQSQPPAAPAEREEEVRGEK